MNFINIAAALAAAAIAPVLAEEPTTLQNVTTRGITMKVYGLEFPVTYAPDGTFVGGPAGQETKGVWRIDGERLCTKSQTSAEVCAVYPAGKKSGDLFEVPGAMGPAMGVITVRIR